LMTGAETAVWAALPARAVGWVMIMSSHCNTIKLWRNTWPRRPAN